MTIINHPERLHIPWYEWDRYTMSYHDRLIVASIDYKDIPSTVDIHLTNFPNAMTDDLFLDIIKLIPDREYLLFYDSIRSAALVLYTSSGHRYISWQAGV